ncbi:hypothetical protein [Botryobacter ruber]|uniref:hypothetical protein n=1 Tax=Botryobacter ruber TaxID=2171629 RepID=UPI000F652DCC|nr:hypothetical protein [Botryobacter ruber]
MTQEALLKTLISLGVKEIVVNSDLYRPEELIRIVTEAANSETVLRVTNLYNKSYTVILELARIGKGNLIIDYRE